MHEGQIVIKKLIKIADTVIDTIKAEADSPGNHPEMGHKVPILDCLGGEVERLPAPGMDSHDLHKSSEDASTCLPLGVSP